VRHDTPANISSFRMEKGSPHMTLSNQLVHQIADPTLTHNERAQLRCQLAKELEDIGNYEAARQAMGELWRGIGHRPALEGLERATAAEVLLRAGVLTGWLGCAKRIEGTLEAAKDLISESLSIFVAIRDTLKAAEAQMELGHCYWREGAFDEARDLLKTALTRIPEKASDLKAVTLLRLATVEEVTLRLSDALRLLTEAAPLFEASINHTIKGRFHNEYATVLKNLGKVECRDDYLDHALIEYTAASYHFEQAGHRRYQGYVENNLGHLYSIIKKFAEAHRHLDRAQALFTSLKDKIHIAQVDDTRAKVLLWEGRVTGAERLARAAAQALELSDQRSLFAEALTTHGIALARLGRHRQARLTLQRGVDVAYQTGDSEGAGQAALSIIEELGEHLVDDELIAAYDRAADLLSASRHQASRDRLLTCAHRVMHRVGASTTPRAWTNFSLKEALRRYEARLIEHALKDAGGAVARAARLLGLKRQSLDAKLHQHYRHLLHLRPPVAPRRSSLMFRDECCNGTQPVTILHVEDHQTVADAVKDTLESEGWVVEACDDGAAALAKLEGGAHYDLLILDNELPGMSGIELIRQTKALAHRQRTPIIMLSASDVETEARRAGASAFLKKPQGVATLAETTARLLARRPRHS
jgi:two-component system, chemotaxis family, chemotaxis protein CheY